MDRYLTDRDVWEVSPEIRKNRTFVHILGARLRKAYKDQYADMPSFFLEPGYLPEAESGYSDNVLRFF